MKKIIYLCDRCQSEIDGLPVKLVPYSYDQNGDVTELPSSFAEAWAADLQLKDYCIGCFEKIVKFIMPEEFDLTDEEAEEIVETEELEEPQKKGRKLPALDRGKIRALYIAGRDVDWIAGDMHCSKSAIYGHLKAMREAGEIE